MENKVYYVVIEAYSESADFAYDAYTWDSISHEFLVTSEKVAKEFASRLMKETITGDCLKGDCEISEMTEVSPDNYSHLKPDNYESGRTLYSDGGFF